MSRRAVPSYASAFLSLWTVSKFLLLTPKPGFGGEENPSRVEAYLLTGDVILVPAGVGHRLLDDFNSDFQMVGSYTKGKSWDMCYGRRGEEEKVKGIRTLGWFEKDPLYGDQEGL